MTKQNIGLITEFLIKGYKIKVHISNHGEKRLRKRIKKSSNIKADIDEYVVASNILALGKRVIPHCKNNDDVAIIDEDNNITVIAEFIEVSDSEGKVNIITILDKTNIYVKDTTTIERLK
jgi:hypothetical protein